MVSKKSAVSAIPIARSYIDRRESALVSEVLASGWLSQGRMVDRFESSLSEYTGAKYAIAVSSGTTALHLALLVSGVMPGDEVIIPSFSFIATANSVLYCGAKPVFIDIDPRTYNIEPGLITEFIEKNCRFDRGSGRLINRNTGARISAIMPVHQFGLACDLDSIEDIASRYVLPVVEDAACGLGSSYKGRALCDGRNVSCLSFHPRKIITTGEGGAILTNNGLCADKLRVLRNHGASLSAMDKHSGKASHAEDYEELGYNYRMTDIQAAIGVAQMVKLDSIINKRRLLAKRYDRLLYKCDSVQTPVIPMYARPNYQSYVVTLKGDLVGQRDAIVAELAEAGISSRRGNTAIHKQSLYRRISGALNLPATEGAASNAIALPIYFSMTAQEQSYVADRLMAALIKRSKPDRRA